MPMAGWVFVLDGVLIGAGDGRFLAWAGMATLVVYVPFALAVREATPRRALRVWRGSVGGVRGRLHAGPAPVTTGWRARGIRAGSSQRLREQAKRPAPTRGTGRFVRTDSAQAATTLTVTVADTPACRRTDTWYSPRALIG